MRIGWILANEGLEQTSSIGYVTRSACRFDAQHRRFLPQRSSTEGPIVAVTFHQTTSKVSLAQGGPNAIELSRLPL